VASRKLISSVILFKGIWKITNFTRRIRKIVKNDY
jgi:hypothetical protein